MILLNFPKLQNNPAEVLAAAVSSRRQWLANKYKAFVSINCSAWKKGDSMVTFSMNQIRCAQVNIEFACCTPLVLMQRTGTMESFVPRISTLLKYRQSKHLNILVRTATESDTVDWKRNFIFKPSVFWWPSATPRYNVMRITYSRSRGDFQSCGNTADSDLT